jgi:LemA protein
MLIVFGVVLVVVLVWVASAYNGLVSLKNQVANAWKQIDVQLKRRHDLIPNLVETVKGAMQFEKGTLEAVVTARNQAVAVQASGGAAAPNVAATAAAEGALSGALGRLLAVVEAYPDLKSVGNASQLQEELTSTENKIAFARQMYNDTATMYNTRQQQFPTVLVAGLAGATRADLWEITDAAERENVRVDLSSAPATGAPATPARS